MKQIYTLKGRPLPASGTLKELWKLQAQTVSESIFLLAICDTLFQLQAQAPNIFRFNLQSDVWLTLISVFLEVRRILEWSGDSKIIRIFMLMISSIGSLSFEMGQFERKHLFLFNFNLVSRVFCFIFISLLTG